VSFVRTMIDHGINYCQTVTITVFVVKILMAIALYTLYLICFLLFMAHEQ